MGYPGPKRFLDAAVSEKTGTILVEYETRSLITMGKDRDRWHVQHRAVLASANGRVYNSLIVRGWFETTK